MLRWFPELLDPDPDPYAMNANPKLGITVSVPAHQITVFFLIKAPFRPAWFRIHVTIVIDAEVCGPPGSVSQELRIRILESLSTNSKKNLDIYCFV
jgi:hypothetical protein